MASQSGSHSDLAYEELDSPSTAYHPLDREKDSPESFGSKTVINPERRGADSGSSVHHATNNGPSSSFISRLFNPETEAGQIPNPEGVELQHFRLERQIGSGGMGSVFKAIDVQLNRVVALKVLSPRYSNDTAAIKRFRNESRSAAALEHENIAKVYYYGEDHGLNFIAFEFIEGVNIRELIRRKGSIPPLDALSYTLQIAAALSHTAGKGVFHRDVKPSNIIVRENGRAILVDWGLARSVNNSPDQSADLTVAGTTLGTFDYISPEQARDPRNVDERSDIYSLGCTFYHMLTGEPPYGEGNVMQKLLHHQDKVVPNPSEKNSAVIPEMSEVVMKMMASDPSHRYQTVAELMHDLTLLAGHLGLHGVPAESVIWTHSQPLIARRNYFEENVGWFAVIAILFIAVFLVEYINRPSSNQFETPNKNAIGSSENGVGGAQSLNGQSAPADATGVDPDVFPLSKVFPNEDATSIQVGSSWMKDILIDLDSQESGNNSGSPADGPTNLKDLATSDDNATASASNGNGSTETKGNMIAADEMKSKLFRLINRSGVEVASYDSLQKAITAASDMSTIKVYSPADGHAIEITEPILVRDKHLTLRADSGFIPSLHFSSASGSDKSHAIRIEKGSLELINLNINIDVEKIYEHPSQRFVDLMDAEHFAMKNVSVTVNNQNRVDYAVMGVTNNSNFPNMKKMMTNQNAKALDVVVDSVVVRGHGDFLSLRSADMGKFTVRQTAVALDGVFLRNQGEETFRSDEERDFEVSLENVTTFLQQGFMVTDLGDQPNSSAIITVNSRRCIYSIGQDMPFVAMSGNVIPTDFIDFLFFWEGDQNFFENTGVMLTIDGAQGEDPIPDIDNLKTWGDWSNTQASGERIVWATSNRPADFASYTIQNFLLDPNADPNPASTLEVGVNPDMLRGIVDESEKNTFNRTTEPSKVNTIEKSTSSD